MNPLSWMLLRLGVATAAMAVLLLSAGLLAWSKAAERDRSRDVLKTAGVLAIAALGFCVTGALAQ